MVKKCLAMDFLLILVGVVTIFWAIFMSEKDVRLINKIGETVEIHGVVNGDVDFDGKTGSLRMSDLAVNGEYVRGKIYVNGQIDQGIQRNDKITIRGKLSEGFGNFSASVWRPEIIKIEKPEPESLVLRLRNEFSEKVKDGLDEKEANLGLAYLLGMRSGIDNETLKMMQLVGLTHIVVASGTHLGILTAFMRRLFGKISRFAGMLFGFIFIIFFGGVVGWTASITRAVIITGIMMIAKYRGRDIQAWKLILIAVIATLLIEPTNIVDIGWQLSFASFTGILVLAPILIDFLYGRQFSTNKRKSERPNKLTEIIIASIATTIMCAPILLYNFGTLSLISVVANVLILPTMPVAMGLTLLTGVVGTFNGWGIFGLIRTVVGGATKLVLDFHLVVMEFFSKQVAFILQIEKNNPKVFYSYMMVGAVILVYVLVCKRRRQKFGIQEKAHGEVV